MNQPIGRLRSVVIDCVDPAALADFWQRVLGYVQRQNYPDWVSIAHPRKPELRLSFRQSQDYRPPTWPAAGTPLQFHLDLAVDDLAAADTAAVAAGARRLSEVTSDGDEQFRVYADPAGHPFCLIEFADPDSDAGNSTTIAGRSSPRIRPAEPSDIDLLHRFILELAETQHLPEQVSATPDDLARALFGSSPQAEAIVASVDSEPVGFALFFSTYSTVLGRPGIHLEDLYVRPEHRGGGLGLAMLSHLARLTLDRGGARLEWWVLRTNVEALRFYRRLDAHPLDVELLRLDQRPLADLADGATGANRAEHDIQPPHGRPG